MNDAYVTLPFNNENDNVYNNKICDYTTALINDMVYKILYISI
jgi:hypothetical protein